MASGPYSFIDIAVLEEVRARFAAGDALIVLTVDLDEVVWANGPGAALFGFPDIEAIMGASAGLGSVTKRQITAAPGFPRIGLDRQVAVRLASGATSRVVPFLVSEVALPDGEGAVLLALPAQTRGQVDADEAAVRVIGGFKEAGYFAALVGEDAAIKAATDGFAGLGIAADTVRLLVDEVGRQNDRLVKRMVPADGGRIPAAIARLADDPALHLLVAVNEPEQIEPEEASQTTETPATSEAPAPSDADIIEFIDEGPAPSNVRPAGEGDKPTHPQSSGATRAAVGSKETDPDDWYFHEHGDERTRRRRAESSSKTSPETPAAPAAPHAAEPDLAAGPVRFVWRTDADGAFSAISDDFIRAVGPCAADVIGRRFRDVATVFGLDPTGEIAALLDRRDTWSGRSVLWPIAGTDLHVPVDLAALPIYSRDRTFEGFRGFGVVRMGDAIVDPEALGLSLAEPDNQPESEPVVETADAETPQGEKPTSAEPGNRDPFKGEVPVLSIASRQERRTSDKVIRLAEHRPTSPEKTLSAGERNALEEIRARLRRDYETQQELAQGDAEKGVDAPSSGEDAVDVASLPEAAALEPSDIVANEADGAPSINEIAVETAAAMAVDFEDTEGAPDTPEETSPAVEAPEAPVVSGGAAAGTDTEVAPVDDDPAGDADESPTESLEREIEEEAYDVSSIGELDGVEDEEGPTVAALADTPIAATGFTPSAFSTDASGGVDADLIGGLPLPVLIHAGDDLYFANREFLKLTGYASLNQIQREGGLDRLFVDRRAEDDARGPDGAKLRLRTLGGEEFPVDAHLQSVRWRGRSALLLALQRIEQAVPAAARLPAAPSSEDGLADMERRVEEMRTIIDTATDGVVLIANDGTIRTISRPAEALFGFDSAAVEGKPFASLFAIESQRAARDYLNGLAENGVASVLNDGREVIGREAEGRFIPLFMTIGRLPEESGYCAVVRDITQWKRAEEELTQARSQAERASSQKTEFLARVSHEIRTPLNAIIGFSELMIDEKFGPIGSDRYRDYLRDINRSGNHVLDLVNDLLDISKIEAGEQEMNYEAVSLNDTLAESVAMMQPQANRDRVIIRSSLASRLPEVVADLRSVRQIALNLLSNAIRYTQAGGQVIVSTSYEASGDVLMRVRDTGIGMTLGEIDQALKPFKQINALKRGRHDGTGLGLPLTKAMVEANRARFSIASTPGEGTLVEITFPSTRVLAD